MEIIKEDKKEIKKIITALNNGAVLVLPTDTVYGLVCDAENTKALEKIFAIKKRPKSKPLLLFVENIKKAQEISYIDKKNKKIIKEKWPGKFTFILNVKTNFSPLISKDKTVGIRVPNYKFLNLILKNFKKPLAQTSANISDNPASTKITNVIKEFEKKKNQPDIIIDAGNLPKSEPSTIINITKDNIKIIRS